MTTEQKIRDAETRAQDSWEAEDPENGWETDGSSKEDDGWDTAHTGPAGDPKGRAAGSKPDRGSLKPDPAADPKTGSQDGTEGKKGKGKFRTEVLPYIMIFAVVLFIRIVFLLNCTIPTGSMENTIMTGTRVMGLKCSYWFSEPERGDIVVFYPPDKPHKLYVKRLIGIPGDVIEIVDGVLYLNGEAREEPYLAEEMYGNFGPYEVPEGAYFFLGDNRNDSLDARFWSTPYVYRDKIVGKVFFSYWPKIEWLAD